MPPIAHPPTPHRIFVWLWIIAILPLVACQVIAGLSVTYVPTPTFPPFPQPSPTLTASPSPSPTSAAPVMIVSLQKQEDSPDRYTIKINYPYLQGASDPRFQLFNQEVDKLVSQTSQDFKNNLQSITITPDPNFTTSSFQSVDYTIQYGEHGLLSVLFTVDFYVAGAAHPNQYFETLNLDIGAGKVLALKDLFKPGADYLKAISTYSIQDLTRQGRLEWDTGAAPQEDNFHSWNITPVGLLISFDPYQVTSYALGPQAVTIPYSDMKDILNSGGPLAPILH